MFFYFPSGASKNIKHHCTSACIDMRANWGPPAVCCGLRPVRLTQSRHMSVSEGDRLIANNTGGEGDIFSELFPEADLSCILPSHLRCRKWRLPLLLFSVAGPSSGSLLSLSRLPASWKRGPSTLFCVATVRFVNGAILCLSVCILYIHVPQRMNLLVPEALP